MSAIEITFDPTFEEYAQGYRAVIPRQVPVTVWVSLGLVLCTAMYDFGRGAATAMLMYTVAALYAAVNWWYNWASTRAYVRGSFAQLGRYAPTIFRLAPEGVVVSTAQSRYEIAWSLFEAVVERRDVLVLKYSRSCMIIPKRSIPPGSAAALRELIDASVPPK